MPAVSLDVSDLEAFAADIEPARAQAMIDDAIAVAARVAPCILDADFAFDGAAKAVLRGAILRWNDTGSGAFQQQSVGPFAMAVDTRQQRRGMFWPSEITQLQELCRDGDTQGQAFTIDTTPADARDGYWAAPDLWVPLT